MPTLELQTERLSLRPLVEDDFDDMAALLGDAEALVLWGGLLTSEQVHSWAGDRVGMDHASEPLGHGVSPRRPRAPGATGPSEPQG